MGQRRIVKYFNGGNICNCEESDEHQPQFEEKWEKENDHKSVSKSEKEDSYCLLCKLFPLKQKRAADDGVKSGRENELPGGSVCC